MSILESLGLNDIITSVSDADNVNLRIRRFFNVAIDDQYFLFYRGHGSCTWELTPRIARCKLGNRFSEVERDLLTAFAKKIKAAGLQNSIITSPKGNSIHSEWLQLAQAQHYELPTRFMDWTFRPDVGLYFAVRDSKMDNVDGNLWIYLCPEQMFNTDSLTPEYIQVKPLELTKTIFLNTEMLFTKYYKKQTGVRRRLVQGGRFCVQPTALINLPLDLQDEHLPNLKRLVIPCIFKRTIREELKALGVCDKTVLPKINKRILKIVSELRDQYELNQC